jgi:hypothetical protein
MRWGVGKQHMSRRRSNNLQGLTILNRGSWCVVSDRTNSVLSWIEIGSTTDWRVHFAEVIQAARSAGWVLESEGPAFSSFFVAETVSEYRSRCRHVPRKIPFQNGRYPGLQRPLLNACKSPVATPDDLDASTRRKIYMMKRPTLPLSRWH